MDTFHDKKSRALLVTMAKEDPNEFIQRLYHAGLDDDEREDLHYLLTLARRAPGYDAREDDFLKQRIA